MSTENTTNSTTGIDFTTGEKIAWTLFVAELVHLFFLR